MKQLLLLLFVLVLPCVLFSQHLQPQAPPSRTCGTEEVTAALLRQHPEYAQQLRQIQQDIQNSIGNRSQHRTKQGVITIPVVFHVVYNNANENIPDRQLLSQLQILNEDFQRLNADSIHTPSIFRSVAANARIEFCLAQTDPQGNPTSGITRTRTSHGPFNATNNDIKFTARGGQDIWDRDKYLNIWVGNIEGNLLGYAQLPGGPAATDGVVLIYYSIGRLPDNPFQTPYNRGRTATHEIGHWLGLRHIWGEHDSGCSDSDGIPDTPNQDSATTNCPIGIKISCNNGPAGDMYQNFMDYTPDACMNLFTKGQAAAMHAVLNGSRRSLLSAITCIDTLIAGIIAIPPAVQAGGTIDFRDASRGRRSSWLWNFEGATPATSTAQHPGNIRYDAPGRYRVTLTVSDGNRTATATDTIVVTGPEPLVYPNPATGTVTIELPADATVEIINAVGQLVQEIKTQSRLLEIDARAYAAGTYLIRIRTEGKTTVKRLLFVR